MICRASILSDEWAGEQHDCATPAPHWGDHECDCGHRWRNDLHSIHLGSAYA